jgi:hypothetical protein
MISSAIQSSASASYGPQSGIDSEHMEIPPWEDTVRRG